MLNDVKPRYNRFYPRYIPGDELMESKYTSIKSNSPVQVLTPNAVKNKIEEPDLLQREAAERHEVTQEEK